MVNIVMYFQKNFFLKEAIDDTLDELATAGLLQYWINKFADKKYLNWQDQQMGPQKLQLEHLRGIFNLGFIGLGVATIVFIIENFLSRRKKFFKKKQRRHKKLLKIKPV